MNFNEYQQCTGKTAQYPDKGQLGGLLYTVLGLCGEAGELANKVKKVLRDDNGILKDSVREKLSGEVGDVLWYLSQVAKELNLEFDVVANQNIDKLFDRLERGVICGAGDNR